MEIILSLRNGAVVPIGEVSSTVSDDIILSAAKDDDELLSYLEILGAPQDFVPERYIRMIDALGLRECDALRVMPNHVLRVQCQLLVKSFRDALENPSNEEYVISYLTIKRFLRSLSASLVCQSTLDSVIAHTEHAATADRIKSLSPTSMGCTQPVIYSMQKSATGRLTVTAGPQILTLPAESRRALKSRFTGGSVLQIDLIAAEPKIALAIQGKKLPIDVYHHISEMVLGGQVTRKEAKLITLCALYGQSPKNLKKSLPAGINARAVIRKTKDYFDADRLISDLRRQSRDNDFRNILGRPLKVPRENEHLLISYFLQSSAAESAILMFDDWCIRHKSAVPLYVIHDALLVDCDHELSKTLLEKGVEVLRLGDWNFDAKVSQVSNN